MDALLESIRGAIVDGATPEARGQGVEACRTILAALDAKPGEPLPVPPHVEPGPVATALASVIRNTPPDALLDMLVAKLRTLAPDAKPAAPVFNLQRVRIPAP
jgi:hypothetical protein